MMTLNCRYCVQYSPFRTLKDSELFVLVPASSTLLLFSFKSNRKAPLRIKFPFSQLSFNFPFRPSIIYFRRLCYNLLPSIFPLRIITSFFHRIIPLIKNLDVVRHDPLSLITHDPFIPNKSQNTYTIIITQTLIPSRSQCDGGP